MQQHKSWFSSGPGIFFILPCLDNYMKVDLRTVTFDVPPQEVRTTMVIGHLEHHYHSWLGLRSGDSPTEKTVEWMPFFTDSVIWIFGFSPFLSPFPNCPSLCWNCYHIQESAHVNHWNLQEKIPYYLNPLFYSHHGDKEAVSDISFTQLVFVFPSLRNSNNSSRYNVFPHYLYSLSVSLLSIMFRKRDKLQ